MDVPAFPEEIAQYMFDVSAHTIEGRKVTRRMAAGNIKQYRMTRSVEGIRAYARMPERLFKELMSLRGMFIVTLSNGEKRRGLLMFDTPYYPGHAPHVQQKRYQSDLEPIFTVQFHFADQGAA